MNPEIFKVFFENPLVACVISDYGGSIIKNNTAFENIMSLNTSDEINSVYDFYANREDRKRILDNIDPHSYQEVQFKKPNGKIFWVKINIREIDFDGENCLFSIIEDIDKEKTVEEELKLKETQEKFINDISKKLLNADFSQIKIVIRECMQKIAEFLGAEEAYIVTINSDSMKIKFESLWNVSDMTELNLDSQVFDVNKKLFQIIKKEPYIEYSHISQIPEEIVNENLEKGRKPRPFSGYTVAIDGNPLAYLGLTKTEEGSWHSGTKRVLSALAEIFYSLLMKIENYFFYSIYKQAVTYSNDAVVYVDSKNKIKAYNASFAKMYGVAAFDLSGKSLQEILPPNVVDLLKSIYFRKCIKGKNEFFEIWNKFSDGVKRFLEFRLYPYRDTMGVVIGLVLIIHDKTDNYRYETEILNLREKERQKLGLELHDDLSHDMLELAIKANLLAEMCNKCNKENNTYREIKNLEQKLNQTLEKIRSLSRRLCSFYEADSDLYSMILKLSDKAEDLNVLIEYDTIPDVKLINSFKAENLYYILSESIINIIKHTLTKKIKISVETNGSIVTIRLSGDGSKINRRSGKSGIGLKIIKCRARLIEASVEADYNEEGKSEVMINFDNSLNGAEYA